MVNTVLPYQDASRPVDERVQDLIARMTLQEKVSQLTQATIRFGALAETPLEELLQKKIGPSGIGTVQDLRSEDPVANAEFANAVQKYLRENTRLGIPALIVAECLHGHLSGGTTTFPQSICLASSWEPELAYAMASAVAREARAVGSAQALSPNLDLGRDPRWGRTEETYGEDPYLVARMGAAFLRGMQGDGATIDQEHMVVTPKHFAAHGSPEAGINLAPVSGSLRDLYTLYLPPFEAVLRKGGALSVMPAYSEFDGIPAHASKLLLQKILRDAWGFEGYVFSDYGGVTMLKSFHRTAATAKDAGRQALRAGMDLEAPGPFGYGQNLVEMVEAGEIPVDWIDRSVKRVLRVKFLAGLFENGFTDVKLVHTVLHCDAHRQLARHIAHQSIVLLKNDKNLLPLDPSKLKSIALVGPNADQVQLGNYCMLKDGDVTLLQGLREALPETVTIHHAQGCEILSQDASGIPEAVEAAHKSDLVIVAVGGTSTSHGGIGWGGKDKNPATGGEGYDMTDLRLAGKQEELLRAIHATGTPMVVVLIHGRPYAIEWLADNVSTLVDAWYPGEEGGHAIADILLGKVNPSGKLPVSIPRSVGHLPVCYNHKPSARGYYHKPGTPDKPGRDYVYSSPTPVYPFGYGLSYTTFAYGNLQITPRQIDPDGMVTVTVEVTNTGDRAGKEVVQLCVNDTVSSVTTPVKVLRGFEKVDLQPGEARTVRFTLDRNDLKLLEEEMEWVVEPGVFEVMVGSLKDTFEVVLEDSL